MSEPQGPGAGPKPEPVDPEYAAALDRFLDGITLDGITLDGDGDGDGDGDADAQVRADTDAIAHALGLIGGALAGEGSARAGASAAAGAVPPAGATVVAMSSWRSRLNPRVLAAAASLLVVVGVGIPLTMNSTGGSSNDEDATTAISAPEPAADSAEAAPMAAPEAGAPQAVGDDYGTDAGAGSLATTDASGKAAAAPGAGAATGGNSGTATAGAAAPAATSARDAAKQAATPQFADAVACARAIVVGTVTGIQPAPDGRHYDVTILVEDWIAPASGPVSVTHQVFGSMANSPGEDESVRVGMRRLFVIAASPEERIYAFTQADWPETRKRIAAIRAERAGSGC